MSATSPAMTANPFPNGAKISPPIKNSWMVQSDLTSLVAIDNLCFDYPYTREDFLKLMRTRGVSCVTIFATVTTGRREYDVPVGYMIYEVFSDSVELICIAIDPKNYQRLGIGRGMINCLKRKRGRVSCYVRLANVGALNFLKAQGFRCVYLVNNYWAEEGEDACYMVWEADPNTLVDGLERLGQDDIGR